jgi:DNA-binding transcriptional LysR family regulator
MIAAMSWDDYRFLLALHRAGTLARAGAAMRIAPTTVGRRIEALERDVGTRLFDRTPDGWRTTPAGLALAARAERIEAEVSHIARSAAALDERAAGMVRVTASDLVASRLIAPHLGAFGEAHPAIQIDLLSTRRLLDLGRREADVAVMWIKPRQGTVVARRVAEVRGDLYAAKTLLWRTGEPEPEDRLRGFRLIAYSDQPDFRPENAWLSKRAGEATVALRTDSIAAAYEACRAGAGVALLPRVIAHADRELRALRTRGEPPSRILWLAVHRDLAKVARIRAVCDFLVETLRRSCEAAAA